MRNQVDPPHMYEYIVEHLDPRCGLTESVVSDPTDVSSYNVSATWSYARKSQTQFHSALSFFPSRHGAK